MSDQTQDVGTEAGRALDELVAERVMGFEWREANPMPGRESIESTALPASARATGTTPEGEGA
jgi:hypothetical protein